MASNQPHNKRDAGGDQPGGKSSPSKNQPSKPVPAGDTKAKKGAGGNK